MKLYTHVYLSKEGIFPYVRNAFLMHRQITAERLVLHFEIPRDEISFFPQLYDLMREYTISDCECYFEDGFQQTGVELDGKLYSFEEVIKLLPNYQTNADFNSQPIKKEVSKSVGPFYKNVIKKKTMKDYQKLK